MRVHDKNIAIQYFSGLRAKRPLYGDSGLE